MLDSRADSSGGFSSGSGGFSENTGGDFGGGEGGGDLDDEIPF